MSTPGMSASLDDRLNPVVLKEMRQALRARFVVGLLFLVLVVMLLLLGLFVSWVVYETMGRGELFTVGAAAFFITLGLVQVASSVLVPAFVAFRLLAERASMDFALMTATNLRPSSIVFGKLLSGVTIAFLLYCVATPFLTFTYLLRGIDVTGILLTVAAAFLLMLPSMMTSVLLASLPVGRVMGAVLVVGALLAGLLLVPMAMATLGSFVTQVGTRILEGEFWQGFLSVALVDLMGVAVLFSFACSAIAPPASNRATAPRVVLTLVWAGSGAIAAWWARQELELLLGWYYAMLAAFAAMMLAAVSQRDEMGMRVAREVPRALWRRLLVFPFFSTSAGGLLWAAAMAVATIAAGASFDRILPAGPGRGRIHVQAGAALGLYMLGYSLAALHLRRHLLARWIPARFTWALGAGLLGLVAGTSAFFDLLAYSNVVPKTGLLRIGSPFVLYDEEARLAGLGASAVVLPLLLLLGIRWFVAQVRAFRPSS